MALKLGKTKNGSNRKYGIQVFTIRKVSNIIIIKLQYQRCIIKVQFLKYKKIRKSYLPSAIILYKADWFLESFNILYISKFVEIMFYFGRILVYKDFSSNI